MPNAKLFSFSDPSIALGEYILSIQNAVLATGKPHFTVAVSGGSLPKSLKKAIIDNKTIASQIQWPKWKIYFADERVVPLNHEDSNYGLIDTYILKELIKKQVLGPEVFAINENLVNDPLKIDDIALEYESLLPEDKEFDLVLLGSGPDGHTCSLFPNHPLLKVTDKFIVSITDSPKPPPRRITFTFPLLANSSYIAFVAEGSNKTEILSKIFAKENHGLPTEIVNALQKPNVSWFINDAAGNGLPEEYFSKYN
ncbi:6-phosphogluconolactonase [Ascoidea rubescens DSM 1968]|uniref:6-phosphogluconolactonase-like protein n=1 Tax=Ascoidea rubescens DSM 1968 TaxID=1344418 RepID=A0A1D2VMW2_9ASCO|nr:6-phosphogluconolactonase [Ascoidea rubescens DSM 1968]ODV62948.1 6-phosphogluconolactonase [Ascoidea rubescens DSM 1968]